LLLAGLRGGKGRRTGVDIYSVCQASGESLQGWQHMKVTYKPVLRDCVVHFNAGMPVAACVIKSKTETAGLK
jgi:hypothetical protein